MTITVASEKIVSSNEPWNWLVGTSWSLREFDGRKVTDRDDTYKGGWDFYALGKVRDILGSWDGTWKLLYYTPDLMCVRVFISENDVKDAFFINDNFFIGVWSNTRQLKYVGEKKS